MAVVEPEPTDVILGLEMGPDVSVVATGTRQDVEKCVNTGAMSTLFNKHDIPSTVAFSGKIRLYGEEAECRVNYEPKDTLVCLPMWIPVRTTADGQEVERRLTHAPVVEVTIHKGNVTFHVDVDRKKVAVPMPVVLGDFIRYLRYMGLVMNGEFRKRVGNTKGAELREKLQKHGEIVKHVGVVVVPAFINGKDLRVLTAALAVTQIPMQIINRTSAIVNWWCCDKLPTVYEMIVQLQKEQQKAATAAGKAAASDDRIRIGILDVGATDTSFIIVELLRGDHPDVNQEHLKTQPQQKVAVKVLAGETAANLGYLDIIRLLSEKVKQHIKDQFHVEIREHTERYWKLSLACAKCIRTLSDVEESVVDIDDFVVKKTHLRMDCSRKHLQNICAPLIEPYRKFLLNTLARATAGTQGATAGAAAEQKSEPLNAVYAVGTHIRIPWILEVTEEVLGAGEHFPVSPSSPTKAGAAAPAADAPPPPPNKSGCCCEGDLKGRLHFITERGGQVAAYGAAYFAAGKSYIKFLHDEGQPYTDAELTEMTSLEQQLTQIEHREIVRRETYAKVNSYVLEMRHSALSTYPTLLQDPDRTAKVLRDAEAQLTSLRDASEEQLKKVHQEFRSYFEGHEKKVYEKVEEARMQRLAEEKHQSPFDPRRAMDLVIRHIGEDKDAPLPPDACAERGKRDLEEAKRLIESGQYDLGIYTAEKSLNFIAHIDAKDLSDSAIKDRVAEIKLEAPLQLAKAETLKAEHDRAIEQRGPLLNSAITHCTDALAIDPSNVDAYLLRGRAYMAKDDLANAEKDAQSGLQLVPGSLPLRALHVEVEQRKKRQAK